MKTIAKIVLPLMLLGGLPAWAAEEPNPNAVENVEYLPVAQLPARVVARVKETRPNMYATSASKQLMANDHTYYTVYGSEVNRFWVLTVRADGKLIQTREDAEPRTRAD